MPELVEPTVRLRSAWTKAHAEWGAGLHEDGFGLSESDDVSTSRGFESWLHRLNSHADPTRTIDVGKHACIYRWIVERDEVLGGIALRYGDDEYVRWAGHVGYGITPSARRRGLGTWALGQILNEARSLGLTRVLLVCEPDNVGSIRTIERCGGVFETIGQTEFGPLARYWVEL